MVIKSKGWTAIPAVKIVSFALVILLAFAFGGTVFMTSRSFQISDIDFDIVFANASGNDLFYSNYMNDTLFDLQALLYYKNEDNIKAGNCLTWIENEDENGWKLQSADGARYRVDYGYTTKIADTFYGAIENEDSLETEFSRQQLQSEREQIEKEAINRQLQDLRRLEDRIQRRNGLVFYVSVQGFERTNADRSDMEFFLNQPVHLLVERGICIAQSQSFYIPSLGDSTIYMGYTAKAINEQNEHWQSMQRTVIAQISVIIGLVILACALFTTLLYGAGRKRGDNSVHFNIMDKPYLDIGGFLLFCYELAILSMISSIITGYGGSYIRDSDNTRWILAIIAVGVTLALAPVLCYTMSFAKRVKAGKWWRHTFTWQIWNSIRSACVNFVKSLWAGVPLTLRVGLICVCLWGVMFSIGYAGSIGNQSMSMALVSSMSLCSVALIAVFMLRYARKLNRLETGAKAVSEGKYGDIDLGEGADAGILGKIAGHINNISAGIESAVDERLKSERLKTELITNVSHDIRTPLTSLITYTDLLKNEGLTSERAPEYLDILIQKSQRLKTLTDELFEAAKASSGNIETHIENLDFAALMSQVLGELDERIQASGLDFRTNLPEHMWISADGKLLWRIAENLLSNVFKYSLPQSRVYISLASENGYARLDIKNISAEPLNMEPSELTERFKRGDDSRSSEGSGLGLSIVQSFAEAQNGRFKIAIDGDLFKASVFMPTI